MSTLKLNASGDLALENGSLVLLADPVEETAQRLRSKFKMVLGEWHLDPRIGIPLYEEILVKNPDLGAIAEIYREVLLGDEGIQDLDTLTLDLDDSTRALSISFEALHVSGAPIVFDQFVLEANR